MKVRFDGLDVLAMVSHLQRTVLGRRVINIYDGDSGDTYIVKLDGGGSLAESSNKVFLFPVKNLEKGWF